MWVSRTKTILCAGEDARERDGKLGIDTRLVLAGQHCPRINLLIAAQFNRALGTKEPI